MHNLMSPFGQTPVQIAAPINDVQLIALIAAHKHELTAKEAVSWALEVVAEAVTQVPKLEQMLNPTKPGIENEIKTTIETFLNERK